MATFDEQLPEWNEPGVEPPQSKKDSGYQPGDKPPAQWFNWFMHRIYKVLQELQAKVAFKADVGDMSTIPTEAKTAAGAITELYEAIQDIDVDIPDGSITPEKLSFDPATQAELDAHANATNVHGATSAATASRLIIRDAAGRAKVAAPAASDDIARLDSITKAQAGLGSVDNYATANQAQAEAGAASNLFMTPLRTKQYVDKRLLNNVIWRINAGQPEWSVDGGTTWKGAGAPVFKNPVGLVGQLVGIATTAEIDLINVIGGGILNSFSIQKGANNNLAIRFYIDGDLVNTAGLTGTSNAIYALSDASYLTSSSTNNRVASIGSSYYIFEAPDNAAGRLSYPLTTEPPAYLTSSIQFIPSGIVFESSLRITYQMSGVSSSSINYSALYAIK